MSTASTAVTSPPPVAPRSDFPTWLPPMLVKELRQGLRTRGFVLAFVIFQFVMALMMVVFISSSTETNAGARASTMTQLTVFFWMVLAVLLLIVSPSRALGSLQTEVESRTIDLLVLTRLSAWRIVLGKWTSLLVQAVLLLVAMMPYGIVRYFGGTSNLVSDAALCLALLGGCAVLTAAGLWGSGMPKILRILAPIALAYMGVTGVATGFRGGPPTAMFSGDRWILWVLDGAVVTVFFLVAAVRRIAPVAESHVLLARSVPLLSLVPVPIWAMIGGRSAAGGQLLFASVFLGVVCAIELANVRVPMVAHWRPWSQQGMFGRFAGRLVMPGWQSAMLYTLLAATLVAVVGLVPNVLPRGEAPLFVWTVLLGMTALLTPVIVLSLAEKAAAKAPGGVYILVFGGLSTIGAVVAGVTSMSPLKYTGLITITKLLPVSGFWLSLGGTTPSTEVAVGQGAFAAVILVVAMMQAKHYWREFALFELRERLAKP